MYDVVIGRNESDRNKFGMKGVIFLGKHYIKMGQTTSLSNKIYLDIARAHVVYVCGKRGSGKCLTGDSLISLDDGRLVAISDLECNENNIMALNHDLKMGSSEKVGFYKRNVNKVLNIKLRSGKEIKLTPEHPLLTVLGWRKASDLVIGSRIATPRICPNFGSKLMRECEVKLLAYLIAEGHTKRPVLFCNTDNLIVDDFKNSVLSFDSSLEVTRQGGCNYRVNSRKVKRNHLDVASFKRNSLGRFSDDKGRAFEKTSIRLFLEKHGLFNLSAKQKFVPERVMMLPKHLLALFLNRLFSCDGSIYKTGNNWSISYSSSSKRLIDAVHHLLLRFGILSRIRDKKIKHFASFEIVIVGEQVNKFVNEIGFFGEKQIKQQIALSESKVVRSLNVDTIPKEIWNIYRPSNWAAMGKEFGCSDPKSFGGSISYSPSRQKLLQIAEVDCDERLKALASSDIFWDEIVSVKELDGSFDVFDISVPNLHNFVANNIIVHNSYTLGVIAEGLADLEPEVQQNLSIILLDTMGIYWTMKYPNKKDEDLLDQWGMKAKGLPVKIYTPFEYYKEYKDKGVPTDFPFAVNPAELSPDDWCMTFGIDRNDDLGVLIERVVTQLKKVKDSFSIQELIDAVQADDRSDSKTRDAAENRFLSTLGWGLFDKKGTPLKDLAKGGQITVLDVSCYATMPGGGWAIKNMVVGLISQKLFIERMIARKNEEYQQIHETSHYFGEKTETKLSMPLVWLVIDEAHEFLPREGKTSATDPLVTILREGRQPGISLILATQQPGKIHTDVMTQADTLISHRITAKVDTDALSSMVQSYMRGGLVNFMNDLPRVKGAAVVLDDSNERMYPMRVRPRFTWHGGESPMAVKPEKESIE